MILTHSYTLIQKIMAGLVHITTASGSLWGLLSLNAVAENSLVKAFWFMGLCVFIDSIDGSLARKFKVKKIFPGVDGALLDNIVDFFNYVLVPLFYVLHIRPLGHPYDIIAVVSIILAASYQFTQADAKTKDNFFKGFPSYWNFVIFYFFIYNLQGPLAYSIILILTLLSFIPIKYVYPSKLTFLTKNPLTRSFTILSTTLWAFSTAGILYIYPDKNLFLTSIVVFHVCFYFLFSIYHTLKPIN